MMNLIKLLSLLLTSCVILTASAFQDDTKAVSGRVVESPKLGTRTMKKKLIRAAKAGKKKKSGVLKEAVSKLKSTKGPRMMKKSSAASKKKVKEAEMIEKKKRGKSTKGPRYLEEYPPRMMRKSKASKMKVKEARMIGKKKGLKSTKGPRYLEEYRTIGRLHFKSSKTPKTNHLRSGKSSKMPKSSKKSTKIPRGRSHRSSKI